MKINFEKAKKIQDDPEEKNFWVEQVMQVLPTIIRIKTLMPELTKDITA
jgi:hypothetical protein